ncbi:MAG: hypothetical protein HY978_03565 [Candidatus Liptonbacteria bacterium]|nr:hypothetical protein [Candidatus Liptonbacteria bacterium]
MDLPKYDNPRAAEYEQLIEATLKPTIEDRLRTSFAYKWNLLLGDRGEVRLLPKNYPRREKLAKLLEFMKQRLAGQTVFDLGGGRDCALYELMAICGVKDYINVDYYSQSPSDQLAPRIERLPYINFHIIPEDMLRFVSQLTTADNFALNGIDHEILPVQEYRYALGREIARALKPEGIVFGIDVHYDILYGARKENVEFLNLHPNSGYDIWEKQEK